MPAPACYMPKKLSVESNINMGGRGLRGYETHQQGPDDGSAVGGCGPKSARPDVGGRSVKAGEVKQGDLLAGLYGGGLGQEPLVAAGQTHLHGHGGPVQHSIEY